MARMRAVVAERPDGPDGLVVREVPRPEPRPGWALVGVEAFGLNRSEYKTLKGYAGDAVAFPRILGIELVGVVEAVHGDVAAVPQGTTVAALMGEMGRAFDGGYAEYALVPEHQLIALETTLVGRAWRAAGDVRDRRGFARAPRHAGRGNATAARRDVLARTGLPRARPRRGVQERPS
jgi:D-arabinose 1-dehydrogenase-like Zn-dependent alcohol dehydrogenase